MDLRLSLIRSTSGVADFSSDSMVSLAVFYFSLVTVFFVYLYTLWVGFTGVFLVEKDDVLLLEVLLLVMDLFLGDSFAVVLFFYVLICFLFSINLFFALCPPFTLLDFFIFNFTY